jgi:hypothetical protein
MTDAQERLKALRDIVEEISPGDVNPRLPVAIVAYIDAILDAMPEGPGLPPPLPAVPVAAVTEAARRRYTDEPWQTIDIPHAEVWLQVADACLPLPTDSRWIDAGVHESDGFQEIFEDGTCGPVENPFLLVNISPIEPGRYHVWLKPEEDTE